MLMVMDVNLRIVKLDVWNSCEGGDGKFKYEWYTFLEYV